MPAVGLKSYILNNNIKSAVLLAGFPVLLLGVVYGLVLIALGRGGYPYGTDPYAYAGQVMLGAAPLAFAVAGIWFVIAYFSQQAIIDACTGARPVERHDAPELYDLLENLAISRGMKTPALRVIEDEGLNAFATGLHEGQYSVTVTRGLLDILDKDELEAVLGHEMTHIINRDVRLMVICAIFAGIFSLVGQLLYQSLFWGGFGGRRDERRGGGALVLVGIVIVAVSSALAIVLKFALSRQAEYLADAGSVELTKNPDAMIRALQKISGNPFLGGPEQIRAMYIEDQAKGFAGLMDTHPPVEKRIEALVKFAGGRLDTRSGVAVSAPAPDYAEPPEHADTAVPETPDVDAPASEQDAVKRGPWSRSGPWG